MPPKYEVVDRESVGGSDSDDDGGSRRVASGKQSGSAATHHSNSSGSSRMGMASLGSCVVALTNTILGSGMLGLPHAFAACGYLLGLFLLLASGAMAAFALHLLSKCAATVWATSPGPR